MKLSTYPTRLNKNLGRKLPSILDRAITMALINLFSRKGILREWFCEEILIVFFMETVTLTVTFKRKTIIATQRPHLSQRVAFSSSLKVSRASKPLLGIFITRYERCVFYNYIQWKWLWLAFPKKEECISKKRNIPKNFYVIILVGDEERWMTWSVNKYKTVHAEKYCRHLVALHNNNICFVYWN